MREKWCWKTCEQNEQKIKCTQEMLKIENLENENQDIAGKWHLEDSSLWTCEQLCDVTCQEGLL